MYCRCPHVPPLLKYLSLTVVCDATGLSCSPLFYTFALSFNSSCLELKHCEIMEILQSETKCLILLTKYELLTKPSIR